MSQLTEPASCAFTAVAHARAHALLHPLHEPPRILVAEDEPEMRRLIVEALRKDGFEVVEASDGGRLLVHVTAHYQQPSHEVDLIISDIRMPICTGIQILQGLRDAHWTIPVILMTAFGDASTRARAELLGAILFDKPFAIDDLMTAVANLLPRASVRDARFDTTSHSDTEDERGT